MIIIDYACLHDRLIFSPLTSRNAHENKLLVILLFNKKTWICDFYYYCRTLRVEMIFPHAYFFAFSHTKNHHIKKYGVINTVKRPLKNILFHSFAFFPNNNSFIARQYIVTLVSFPPMNGTKTYTIVASNYIVCLYSKAFIE